MLTGIHNLEFSFDAHQQIDILQQPLTLNDSQTQFNYKSLFTDKEILMKFEFTDLDPCEYSKLEVYLNLPNTYLIQAVSLIFPNSEEIKSFNSDFALLRVEYSKILGSELNILLPAIAEEQSENCLLEDKELQVLAYGVGSRIKISFISRKS
jgi:hypothetical protein